MADGTREKIEGTLKEAEGTLTGDRLREKHWQGQEKIGEAGDKAREIGDLDRSG